MRTEAEINAGIQATLEMWRLAYLGNVAPSELLLIEGDLNELRSELNAVLTPGAISCPDCGADAVGIHQPAYYEVGCIHCYGHRSRGFTPAQAVMSWNAQEYFA